jgi:hypothetical protein
VAPLAACLAFIWTGAALGESLSVEAYAARVQEAASLVAHGQGALSAEEAARLGRLLPKRLRIRGTRGHGFRLDQAALRKWEDEARGSEEGRRRLVAHLRSLQAQLPPSTQGARWIPGLEPGQLEALRQVYGLPQFRHLRERQTPDWLEPLLDLIKGLLERLGRLLRGVGSAKLEWVQSMAYGAILVLGIAAIVWVARLFGSTGWIGGQPRSRPAPKAPKPERDWVSWRREADQRASRGEFREAIRCLFVSVLLQGHGSGWWVYQPHATNREHLARVSGPAGRREALSGLVDRFESIWYGLGQPGAGDFQFCEGLVRQMEAAA